MATGSTPFAELVGSEGVSGVGCEREVLSSMVFVGVSSDVFGLNAELVVFIRGDCETEGVLEDTVTGSVGSDDANMVLVLPAAVCSKFVWLLGATAAIFC